MENPISSLSTVTATLLALAPLAAAADEAKPEPGLVESIDVRGKKPTDTTLGASVQDGAEMAARKATNADASHLLDGIPGVSLNGAGGISSLPTVHGLADDRLRIQVDGTDLMPACPNHMNSVLSYADPTRIESVTVFSGITPVSVGGDSIGGSIQVKSAPPEFASATKPFLASGQAGSFYRSNGHALGYNLAASAAGEWLSLTAGQSDSRSDDVWAGGAFKPVAPGREGGEPIAGDVVGSSAYRGSIRRSLGVALRGLGQLVQLEASQQTVDFEGFPNQRMDMTRNDNRLYTARYAGTFGWGEAEARLSYQDTRHKMDMGADRYFYGTGMPMDTEARTWGASVGASVVLPARQLLRLGAELQDYSLYDFWPPVGGSMGPNTFWNVDYGERRRFDAYAEWEAHLTDAWLGQVGLRSDSVTTDAGPVQGYDDSFAAWGVDAAAFNAARRHRVDQNWDVAALARFTPDGNQTYEGGYARKSRSPNLYQRYPWSTNAMAALMNNFVGDGDGYVGRMDLRPETANTVSLTADWHDTARKTWGVKATAYYTLVQDYIDARRCDFGQCSADNVSTADHFVLLQYVNQRARLYGADLAARGTLGDPGSWGTVSARLVAAYVRGDNLSTGDGLYDIMPLNATLALVHELAGWTNTAEVVAVAGKSHVSEVRNEIRTTGYYVINLRTSLTWKLVRLDVSVENLLDRLYANPLGGAYVGQGSSMSTSGIPWGVAIPGMGRSFNVALSLRYPW